MNLSKAAPDPGSKALGLSPDPSDIWLVPKGSAPSSDLGPAAIQSALDCAYAELTSKRRAVDDAIAACAVNLPIARGGPVQPGGTDSTLRKMQAFRNRINQLHVERDMDGVLTSLAALNLSKFASEIAAALVDVPAASPAQVDKIVLVAQAMHRRYAPDFTLALFDALRRALHLQRGAITESELRTAAADEPALTRLRWRAHLFTELFFRGVLTDSAPLYSLLDCTAMRLTEASRKRDNVPHEYFTAFAPPLLDLVANAGAEITGTMTTRERAAREYLAISAGAAGAAGAIPTLPTGVSSPAQLTQLLASLPSPLSRASAGPDRLITPSVASDRGLRLLRSLAETLASRTAGLATAARKRARQNRAILRFKGEVPEVHRTEHATICANVATYLSATNAVRSACGLDLLPTPVVDAEDAGAAGGASASELSQLREHQFTDAEDRAFYTELLDVVAVAPAGFVPMRSVADGGSWGERKNNSAAGDGDDDDGDAGVAVGAAATVSAAGVKNGSSGSKSKGEKADKKADKKDKKEKKDKKDKKDEPSSSPAAAPSTTTTAAAAGAGAGAGANGTSKADKKDKKEKKDKRAKADAADGSASGAAGTDPDAAAGPGSDGDDSGDNDEDDGDGDDGGDDDGTGGDGDGGAGQAEATQLLGVLTRMLERASQRPAGDGNNDAVAGRSRCDDDDNDDDADDDDDDEDGDDEDVGAVVYSADALAREAERMAAVEEHPSHLQLSLTGAAAQRARKKALRTGGGAEAIREEGGEEEDGDDDGDDDDNDNDDDEDGSDGDNDEQQQDESTLPSLPAAAADTDSANAAPTPDAVNTVGTGSSGSSSSFSSVAASAPQGDLDALMAEMATVSSRLGVDVIAQRFIAICGRRAHSRQHRLVEHVFALRSHLIDRIPLYIRLVATFSCHFPHMAEQLTALVDAEFTRLQNTLRLSRRIDLKLRNVRLIAEMVKFRVSPPILAFRAWSSLLQSPTPHNVHALSLLLEHCGRWLYCEPTVHDTTVRFLSVLSSAAAGLALAGGPSRYLSATLEAAQGYCRPPPPVQARRRAVRSLAELWARRVAHAPLLTLWRTPDNPYRTEALATATPTSPSATASVAGGLGGVVGTGLPHVLSLSPRAQQWLVDAAVRALCRLPWDCPPRTPFPRLDGSAAAAAAAAAAGATPASAAVMVTASTADGAIAGGDAAAPLPLLPPDGTPVWQAVVAAFADVAAASADVVPLTARVLANLSAVYPIAPHVVDLLVELIRAGLLDPTSLAHSKPAMVLRASLLTQCVLQGLAPPATLFHVLHMCLTLGHTAVTTPNAAAAAAGGASTTTTAGESAETTVAISAPTDPPHSTFRASLVLSAVRSALPLLLSPPLRVRLELFLVCFQRYLCHKRVVPIDVEHSLSSLLTALGGLPRLTSAAECDAVLARQAAALGQHITVLATAEAAPGLSPRQRADIRAARSVLHARYADLAAIDPVRALESVRAAASAAAAAPCAAGVAGTQQQQQQQHGPSPVAAAAAAAAAASASVPEPESAAHAPAPEPEQEQEQEPELVAVAPRKLWHATKPVPAAASRGRRGGDDGDDDDHDGHDDHDGDGGHRRYGYDDDDDDDDDEGAADEDDDEDGGGDIDEAEVARMMNMIISPGKPASATTTTPAAAKHAAAVKPTSTHRAAAAAASAINNDNDDENDDVHGDGGGDDDENAGDGAEEEASEGRVSLARRANLLRRPAPAHAAPSAAAMTTTTAAAAAAGDNDGDDDGAHVGSALAGQAARLAALEGLLASRDRSRADKKRLEDTAGADWVYADGDDGDSYGSGVGATGEALEGIRFRRRIGFQPTVRSRADAEFEQRFDALLSEMIKPGTNNTESRPRMEHMTQANVYLRHNREEFEKEAAAARSELEAGAKSIRFKLLARPPRGGVADANSVKDIVIPKDTAISLHFLEEEETRRREEAEQRERTLQHYRQQKEHYEVHLDVNAIDLHNINAQNFIPAHAGGSGGGATLHLQARQHNKSFQSSPEYMAGYGGRDKKAGLDEDISMFVGWQYSLYMKGGKMKTRR